MIFFMTIVVPPENIFLQLKQIQKELFKKNYILPAPFPLILDTVSLEKRNRPSRSRIAELYPKEIHTSCYAISGNNLLLKIENSGSLEGIILGEILDKTKIPEELNPENPIVFANYSLAFYKIQSESTNNFWMNMSWTRIWKVQKKKI